MLKPSVTIGVLFGKLGRLVGLGNAEAFPPNWQTRGRRGVKLGEWETTVAARGASLT